MRYIGGKARLAEAVVREVETRKLAGHFRYVEPFVGGGSVLAKVAPLFEEVVAGDVVPDLVLFWAAVRDGWRPPLEISREEYDSLLNAAPSPLRAWAGFAASYNGRWWGGYGPRASGRDYLAESLRSTMKKAAGIHGHVEFICADFEEHDVDHRTVVYCDPPYASQGKHHKGLATPEGRGSTYASAGFDHARFWRVVDEWSSRGALVLVHEYEAPSGWKPVHTRQRSATMNHKATARSNAESLWLRALADDGEGS